MENWLDWDAWVHTFRGGMHFVAALIALGLGPIILFRRKGTASHRWLGRIWLTCMLFVNLSALIMYDMLGRPNLFHFFALLSLSTIIPGFWAIRKYIKTRERKYLVSHQHFMAWSYFGLASAGIWQVGFRMVLSLNLVTHSGQLYAIFGAFTLASAMWLSWYTNKRFSTASKQSMPNT